MYSERAPGSNSAVTPFVASVVLQLSRLPRCLFTGNTHEMIPEITMQIVARVCGETYMISPEVQQDLYGIVGKGRCELDRSGIVSDCVHRI